MSLAKCQTNRLFFYCRDIENWIKSRQVTLTFIDMALWSKQQLIAYFYVVVHEAAGICKVRVLGVDVCQLDGDQVVNLERNSVEMSEVNTEVKILKQALV